MGEFESVHSVVPLHDVYIHVCVYKSACFDVHAALAHGKSAAAHSTLLHNSYAFSSNWAGAYSAFPDWKQPHLNQGPSHNFIQILVQ